MRIFLIILAVVTIGFSFPAIAQDKGNDISVDKDKISSLLDTLKTEESRQEFINNLEALVAADEKKQEETIPALSDALGVEGAVAKTVDWYEKFLVENDLNGTLVGQIIITIVAILIATFFLFIIQRLGSLVRRKVLEFNNNHNVSHQRFRLYSRIFRYAGYILVIGLLIQTLNVIWELADLSFLSSEAFGVFFGNLVSLLLIAVVAIVIWEVINLALERFMDKATDDHSSRLRTLLPVLRNVLFITFAVLFTLVFMSELGIDIMPLLAGAGVLGIAIGFGAQTMVKDFLAGFTVILEDLIQVGDVATLADKTGIVEKITIRKVQLRGLDGNVYTIPFSDISVVENWTKEFSYYILNVGVAYRENTDEVIEYLREIDEEMRSEEPYSKMILEPLDVQGVDQFADSAVIIKARIKTRPIKQWEVGREFNRRMKFKFDEKGVEIPFPHQTLYFGEDKKGNSPPANIRLHQEKKNQDETTHNVDEKSSIKKIAERKE